jgi:hypothetical protein
MKTEPGPYGYYGKRQHYFPIGAGEAIDEYQIMVDPVALGKGRTMFDGIKMLSLKLISTRTFRMEKCFSAFNPITILDDKGIYC